MTNEIILAGKVLCLLISIAYTFTCVGKICYGHSVSQFQTFTMAAGITGFVTLQWLI
jgi:hypothetical protein